MLYHYYYHIMSSSTVLHYELVRLLRGTAGARNYKQVSNTEHEEEAPYRLAGS